MRPADDPREVPPRASHHVDTPDAYEDWRTYAFSDAPELREASASTPPYGVPVL